MHGCRLPERRCAAALSGTALATALATGLLTAVVVANPAAAATVAEQEVPESRIKAAYLTKFPAYVDWPADAFRDAAEPLTIGVLGADDVLAELLQMVGSRRHHGRPVVARRLTAGEPAELLHVLFVGRTAGPQVGASALRPNAVLLVTEGPAGAPGAGAIHFVRVDGKLRFEASPTLAERAGLRLSARLLAVAERVLAP